MLAVLVAAILGYVGVRLAAKAVRRAQLDYVGQRADVVADRLERLRVLLGAYDTMLTTWWPFKNESGDEPEGWMPVQGKVREIDAACNSLKLLTRGLVVSSKQFGGDDRTKQIGVWLDAVAQATYVEFLYFTNEHIKTRADIEKLYADELRDAGAAGQRVWKQAKASSSKSEGPSVVTTVTWNVFGDCAHEIELLVNHAFDVAGSEPK